ncbi:putative WLM domain, PUB domain, Ubiquitin-like domain superfamily, PUB-like domain superfamily [Helianthus annuus]|nr:putative WLM domain, PUB domain, Ubiquitin-like domain superfamily, PUB-like domain superfamily [Helianthus annuus]
MEQERNTKEISVTWRGKKYVLTMNLDATVEELGQELQKLTAVKSDTLKLIVQSKKSSKLLSPFSDEHSRLTLQETSIIEGKTIRMMGVPKEEIDQVLKTAKMDMRIVGFDEEEKRMRQRISNGFDTPLKLPQGNYVFGDFKTLDLPGIELNPPASEALRLMHTLAADRGIVAIMNKHKWRVGIMTEMAPEGYVGVSPVCILGFNKNHGEEISLRLRTDDLKGFRKYQSIKKTLLHELAHMVHSEHDAKFYALDSQLNKEAEALDWTRSTGHSLSGSHKTQQHEPEFHVTDTNPDAHEAVNNKNDPDPDASMDIGEKQTYEPDPDDDEAVNNKNEPDPDASMDIGEKQTYEPDPDDDEAVNDKNEPDPDDNINNEAMESEACEDLTQNVTTYEPDPDDGILHDEELQRIQDPVVIACNRLKKSIETLQSEVSPSEAATVFQTLVKIVKNVIEHPDETKFKKLRKANPVIQKNIASHNGAMEILFLIGFCEDVVQDEIGRAEAYLVLKRNDPGLLWLAKSSLETCISF